MTGDGDELEPSVFPPSPGCKLSTVTVRAPECPECGSVRLCTKGRWRPGGDGSATRYTRCLRCAHPFKLLREKFSD